jgi:hypothetical protein
VGETDQGWYAYTIFYFVHFFYCILCSPTVPLLASTFWWQLWLTTKAYSN